MELNKCKLIPTDRWKTSGRKCDRMRPATRSCRSSGSKNAMTCASSSPTPSPKPTNPTICSPPGKSSSKNWLMLIAVSSLGHFHFHFHLKISNCCYWLLHDAALITFQSALSFMAFVWGFFEILWDSLCFLCAFFVLFFCSICWLFFHLHLLNVAGKQRPKQGISSLENLPNDVELVIDLKMIGDSPDTLLHQEGILRQMSKRSPRIWQ